MLQNFRIPVAEPFDDETDYLRRRRIRREAQADPQRIIPDRDGSGGAVDELGRLDERHYPKGEGGRPAYPLMAVLRIHLMQNWFGYSDPAMEEALYETTFLRQ